MRDWPGEVLVSGVALVVCIMIHKHLPLVALSILFPSPWRRGCYTGHDISKSREKAFKDGDIVNYT
jgi:hypothetical protein